MTAHVDALELVAYAQGQLRRRKARALREHCRDCEECGDQLAAVLLLREARPAATRPTSWWPRAAAAMLVAALSLSVGWAIGGNFAPAEDRPGAVAGAAPLPGSLEPGIVGMLWNLNRELGTATPAGRSEHDPEYLLRGALESLEAGDPDAALQRLAPLGTGDIRAQLLRGVAQLLVGDAPGAAASLAPVADAAIGSEDAQEQYRHAAMLFLSEAMVRSSDRTAAIDVLEQLAGPESAGRDFYAAAAAARLAELR